MSFEKIDDYRVFIRSLISKKANKGRGEITKLAEFIGVHGTFVSQVLSGAKDLSMEQSFQVADYFQLTPIERKFFLLLVQISRAGTRDLKNYHKLELEELRSSLLNLSNRLKEHHVLSEEAKSIFYSSWLYSGIRLYCSYEKGKTLEEICAYLSLSRVKALGILNFLCQHNLTFLEKDRYKMGTQHTHVPNDSPFVIRHHMNWRLKALQRHENLQAQELAFTCPMSLSKKDFAEIREKLLTCIKESLEITKNSPSDEVAFLNIDWAWSVNKE